MGSFLAGALRQVNGSRSIRTRLCYSIRAHIGPNNGKYRRWVCKAGHLAVPAHREIHRCVEQTPERIGMDQGCKVEDVRANSSNEP